MPEDYTRISIYVPQKHQDSNPVKQLHDIAIKRDRTLNYMVVLACKEFVAKHGDSPKKPSSTLKKNTISLKNVSKPSKKLSEPPKNS